MSVHTCCVSSSVLRVLIQASTFPVSNACYQPYLLTGKLSLWELAQLAHGELLQQLTWKSILSCPQSGWEAPEYGSTGTREPQHEGFTCILRWLTQALPFGWGVDRAPMVAAPGSKGHGDMDGPGQPGALLI